MSILRRYKNAGSVYFITNITYGRLPLLKDNSDILVDIQRITSTELNIEIIASVILPDHFHYLIDTKDHDISLIMQRIKMTFGAIYRKRHQMKRGRIWQNRFWDHIIRDQRDFNNHLNYIHYNPVKHGYVKSPLNWQQSSIHRYFEEGLYQRDWGSRENIAFDGDYGDD